MQSIFYTGFGIMFRLTIIKLRENVMNTDAQTRTILQHLSKHKSITSMQAFELYGITRLSARIFDLRSEGYQIGLIWETCINRFGVPTRYGKYFLIKRIDIKR